MNIRSEEYPANYGYPAPKDSCQNNGSPGTALKSGDNCSRPLRSEDYLDEPATEYEQNSERKPTRTSRGSASTGSKPRYISSQPFSTSHRPFNPTRPPDTRNGKPSQELASSVTSSQNVRPQNGPPRRIRYVYIRPTSSRLMEDAVLRLTRYIQGKSTMNNNIIIHALTKTSVFSSLRFMRMPKERDTLFSMSLRPEELEIKARDTLCSMNLRPEEIEMICWYAKLRKQLLSSPRDSTIEANIHRLKRNTVARRILQNISVMRFLPTGNGQEPIRQQPTLACQQTEITSSPPPVNEFEEDTDVERGDSVHYAL
jgi:hypothetical protein